ncbi:MAG: hypothetical protein AAF581_13385 [Planctomycetota bacterium]
MTAETPNVPAGDGDDKKKPSPDDTAVIRENEAKQSEGYSVRPRPAGNAPSDDAAAPETKLFLSEEVSPRDAGALHDNNTIACEDDVLVLLPSEEIAAASRLQEPGDLSWQTEALESASPGADTEQFSSAHDDVGFLPSEDLTQIPVPVGADDLSWQTEALDGSMPGAATEQFSAAHDDAGFMATEDMGGMGSDGDVPLLTTHPDFAIEATEEFNAAELPELEDVEDITALLDDDEVVELEAPEESFEIDFDEFQMDSSSRTSRLPLVLGGLAAAAAVAVAAVFFMPEAPTPAGGSAEVASANGEGSPAEVVTPGDAESDPVMGEGTESVPDGPVDPSEIVISESPDGVGVETIDDTALVDPELMIDGDPMAPETVLGGPVDNTLEGWLGRSLDRHFDMTVTVQD